MSLLKANLRSQYTQEQIKRSGRPKLTNPIQPSEELPEQSQKGFEEVKSEQGVLKVVLEKPQQSDNSSIYYNLQLENKNYITGLPIEARFDVNRVDEILPRAADYRLTVARFQLPANVPLFIFPEESRFKYFLELTDRTDPDPANWVSVKDFISFLDYCEKCYYPRGVYYVNHMLFMINSTYKQLYNQMKLINPSYAPKYPPKFTFDPATELFTLWAEESYLIEEYQIRCNDILFNQFIPGFQSRAEFDVGGPSIDDTALIFIIEDQFTNRVVKFEDTPNPIVFYTSVTEFSCLPLWNQLEKILLETDSIPIYAEIVGTQRDKTKAVLLDFEPPNDVANRQFYSYAPSIYRWIDLKGNEPLTRVDLKIFIEYAGEYKFPLFLLVDELASIKLLFTQKNTQYQ